jgi:hypothetical protein
VSFKAGLMRAKHGEEAEKVRLIKTNWNSPSFQIKLEAFTLPALF